MQYFILLRTLQKGYPVVMVNRNYSNNSFSLSQKWFLLDPEKNEQLSGTKNWFVPFTFTTKDELSFSFNAKPIWLKPKDSSSRFSNFNLLKLVE